MSRKLRRRFTIHQDGHMAGRVPLTRKERVTLVAAAVRGAACYRLRPRAGLRPWSGRGTRRASSSRGGR